MTNRSMLPFLTLAAAMMSTSSAAEPEPLPSWLTDPTDPRFDPVEALRRLHEGNPAHEGKTTVTLDAMRQRWAEQDRQEREGPQQVAVFEGDDSLLALLREARPRFAVLEDAPGDGHHRAQMLEYARRLGVEPVVVDLTREGIGRGFRPGELVDFEGTLRGPRALPEFPTMTSMEIGLDELLERVAGIEPEKLPWMHHQLRGIQRFQETAAQARANPQPAPVARPEINWRAIEWKGIEKPTERCCAAMGFPESRGLYLDHLRPVAEAEAKRARKAADRSGRPFDDVFNEAIELRREAMRPKPGTRRNALPCMICGGNHR